MTCKYINKKKHNKEEISNPKTLIVINFDFLFFFEKKNWEIAKNSDNQSKRFPKYGAINWIILLLFK